MGVSDSFSVFQGCLFHVSASALALWNDYRVRCQHFNREMLARFLNLTLNMWLYVLYSQYGMTRCVRVFGHILCIMGSVWVSGSILQIQSSVMLAIIICNYQDKERSFHICYYIIFIGILTKIIHKTLCCMPHNRNVLYYLFKSCSFAFYH